MRESTLDRRRHSIGVGTAIGGIGVIGAIARAAVLLLTRLPSASWPSSCGRGKPGSCSGNAVTATVVRHDYERVGANEQGDSAHVLAGDQITEYRQDEVPGNSPDTPSRDNLIRGDQ